ncbi:MAG: leucine-rich repeat domain-containing protein [Acutalibacteraceae bacterium]
MAEIIKEITVDVAKKNLFQAIVAKQYDDNSRFLKVTLQNEGEKITVENTSTVTINAERADQTSKSFFGTVYSDGTVKVPLANWMLELDDVVRCDITVIDSSSRKLTSTSFSIDVEAAANPSGGISEDEGNDILIKLIEAKNACDEATKKALEATQLKDGSVTTDKIDDRAVTSNKIGLYQVKGGNNGNIAQNTINNYNLMEGAVQEENIDDEAVSTAKLANGSVTAEKLSADVKDKIDSDNAVNLGEVNALSTLNSCTDTQKTYFFKVGNSLQGEFEYMTNNAFGILNCYKTSENKYMQTVKIIGNAEFTYKRTYDSEQGSWSEFTYVGDGGYYELDSKIDTLDRFFTADISQLKSDVLDNAEAITQNTADIEELKAMGLPSVNLSIPDFASTIPDFAFCANLNLVTVTIPSSVKTIGICAFYKCRNLDTVNINKGATSIKQGAFSNCTNLSNITIPDSVTALEQAAFSDCTSLTSVTIPDSVTSVGFSVFERCQKLTNVTIGNKLTVIGLGMFRGCTSLASVTIPDSVTSIGGSAFGGCTRLTDVTIPNSITAIASDAFGGCSNLTNVTLGDGFNANGLNLSASTKYTADTIVSWLNALADRTEQEQYTLTIGATNKAKLTDEQLAIATNKNWNIA